MSETGKMFFMRSMQCVFLVGLILVMNSFIANAEADVAVVGGVDGRTSWKSGGGDLPAVVAVIRQYDKKTNSLVGSSIFPENRINWIALRCADTTRNIAIGLNSPLRIGAQTRQIAWYSGCTCLT